MFAAIVIIVAGGFLDGAELKLGEGAGVSRTDYGDLPSGGGGGRFGGDGCHGGCVRVLFGCVLLGSGNEGPKKARIESKAVIMLVNLF